MTEISRKHTETMQLSIGIWETNEKIKRIWIVITIPDIERTITLKISIKKDKAKVVTTDSKMWDNKPNDTLWVYRDRLKKEKEW